MATSFHHPQILPLYDSGQVDRLLHDVTPFLERDVAAAFDCAHRQGVVHRDIKPENVMLHGPVPSARAAREGDHP